MEGSAVATGTLGQASDVAAQFNRWAQALKSGDPARVAALYARDAVLLPTLSDRIRQDTREIVEYFTGFLAKGPEVVILSETMREMGGVAVHCGICRFVLTRLEGKPRIDARFTFVHEWIDGRWQIVAHHSSVIPEG